MRAFGFFGADSGQDSPHLTDRKTVEPSKKPRNSQLEISIIVPTAIPPVPAMPIGVPVVDVPARPPIVPWRVISRPVKDRAANADGNVDASGLQSVGCQKSSRENCSEN